MESKYLDALAQALEKSSCSGLRRTMRVVTNLFDQAFEPIGLRCTQVTVLMAVAVHGPATIRYLSDIVDLDASSLSRALDPLERDGLVVRKIGESRRSREVRITPAGMDKIRQAAPLWRDAQRVFLSVLGEENVAAFEELLERTAEIKNIDLDSAKRALKDAA